MLIAVAAIACSSVSAQEHDEQSERISSLNGKRRWIDPFFDISDFSEERVSGNFAHDKLRFVRCCPLANDTSRLW